MEQRKCLGIYISEHKATGLLLSGHGSHFTVLACHTAERDTQQENEQSLVSVITEKIQAEKLSYDEVSVAVNCGMFTQHNLHSDFSDYKQIANTIRFDAEEAVAMDAMELAVAFNVTAINQSGADVTVYTAKRDKMTDVLNSMLKNAIDPTAMEPDIVCLARFIEKNKLLSHSLNQLKVVIAEKSCYLIMPADSHNAPSVRSFLMSPSQDITSMLAREIPITIASLSGAEPITSISIAGKTQNINNEELSLKTGLDVTEVNLVESLNSSTPANASETDLAIAYGAALAELSRTHKTDFRADFMPYEGRIRAIQKSLRIISAAVTLILIAVGAYFQVQVLAASNQAEELKEKLYTNEAEVIFGSPHSSPEKLTTRLKRELKKVKSGKTGPSAGNDSSVSAKLTYLFEAINKSTANNKLKVTKISIMPKSMKLDGSTRSRSYTNNLFNAIESHPKLRKGPSQVKTKVNEDTFSITIELQN